MIKTTKFITIVLGFMAAVSCRTIESEPNQGSVKGPLPAVQVNALNPLLADLSAFDLIGGGLLTKAGSGPETAVAVPLESLLDRENSTSMEGDGGTWIQTPILDAEPALVFLSDEMSTDYDPVQRSGVRRYLIDSPYEYFIATMIPYYIFSDGDWSYFDKRDFFGIVFLSSLEGELLEAHRYHPSGYSRVVPIVNPRGYARTEIEYINIKGGVMTRVGDTVDGGTLDASLCVAKRDWDPEIPGGDHTTTIKDDTGTGGYLGDSGRGGGGSKTRTPRTYRLTIDIQGNGSALGGGEYEAGIQVNVKALPSEGSNFAYWTGDLKGSDMWKTVRMPSSNLRATAVFLPEGTGKPCYDAKSGTYFPLAGKNKIAPTDKGKPAKSGTYGNVRNGGTRPHRGWDIAATPGTPFFCPIDGKIANFMQTWVPNGRTDDGGCGNRIGVEFNLGGHRYVIFFLHLAFTDKTNPGDPTNGIGINPRTGKLWATGDTVHPGEILGRTGDTGFAYKVTYKHLHFQIHNITDSWPTKTSGWENYEDPSILFGDILEKDGNGDVIGFNVNNGCDEIVDSENAYNFYSDDWRVSFGLYPF